MRRCGERGQEDDGRQIVARAFAQSGKIQQTGEQHHAVEIHAVAGVQMFREAGGAEDAIAFAKQILG